MVQRGIAETVALLSIPQCFAIIVRIAMAAANKSKVDLLQPHRLFYFIRLTNDEFIIFLILYLSMNLLSNLY